MGQPGTTPTGILMSLTVELLKIACLYTELVDGMTIPVIVCCLISVKSQNKKYMNWMTLETCRTTFYTKAQFFYIKI
jgi:hypothetical protein